VQFTEQQRNQFSLDIKSILRYVFLIVSQQLGQQMGNCRVVGDANQSFEYTIIELEKL
jgi:hypothetical protein